MSRLIYIIIFCLCASSLFAQRYKEKHIKKDLQTLAGFEHAFIGFALFDPEKDKMLASHYADKHMTPASNTKLFTFWATAPYLSDQLPAFAYEQLTDEVIFWTTGYPLTLHPEHSDSTLLKFIATIPSDKKISYLPRPTDIERFGAGWGWDDYNGYYGAEKSIFPIYGNSVQFIIDNEKRSFSMTPEYPGFTVNVSDEDANRARVYRDEFWNEFEIHYDSTVNLTSPIDTLVRPFRYSDRLFVELLSDATGRTIELLEDVPFTATESANGSAFVAYGAPRDSLYKWMLQPSDNLFAESLLLMASGTVSDTLSTNNALDLGEEVREMTANRLLPSSLTWVDGSGLSRYNMFKPSEMIGVLAGLQKTFGEETLFELLPQGGVSGTIEDWYAGPNGEPFVFAKTGTLSNNHTLSGFIKTKKGKTLIFSLMANHYTCSTSQIRENFEVILNKIKNAY